jgi:hypothetical protein
MVRGVVIARCSTGFSAAINWQRVNVDVRTYQPVTASAATRSWWLSADRSRRRGVVFPICRQRAGHHGRSARATAKAVPGERLATARSNIAGADAEWLAGNGGVREHDDRDVGAKRRKDFRQLRHRRRRWPARVDQQAVENQSVLDVGFGKAGSKGIYPRSRKRFEGRR